MIIYFKLSEFNEFQDDIYAICEDLEPLYTDEEKNGTCLNVTPFRIIVPQINRSFRLGDLFNRDEAEGASVTIEYMGDEKDINKYISWSTGSLYTVLHYEFSLNDPMVYINTGEFVDDKDITEYIQSCEYQVIGKYIKTKQ